MSDDTIADLRDAWQISKDQTNRAYDTYSAAKEAYSVAHKALKKALIEQYGPCDGKLVDTAQHGEVKLDGFPQLDHDGNLVCRAHDRLKTGKWSRDARVRVTIIRAPGK